jgi:hypothetical protein
MRADRAFFFVPPRRASRRSFALGNRRGVHPALVHHGDSPGPYSGHHDLLSPKLGGFTLIDEAASLADLRPLHRPLASRGAEAPPPNRP